MIRACIKEINKGIIESSLVLWIHFDLKKKILSVKLSGGNASSVRKDP